MVEPMFVVLGKVFRRTLLEEVDKWVPERGFSCRPFSEYDGAKIVVFWKGNARLVVWGPERFGTYTEEPHYNGDQENPPVFTYRLHHKCVTIRALRRMAEEAALVMGRYLNLVENDDGEVSLIDNDSGSVLINDIYAKLDRITLEESCR